MRTPVLAANWKMFKTTHETLAYVRQLGAMLHRTKGVEIVVAPPATSLVTAAEAARNTRIGVAAQNMHFEREGAFTGEVSAAMIKDAGATYVIVGHSERRRMFGDTDEWVNKKIKAAIGAELTPIFCVGETLAEREAGQTLAVLDRQVRDGLAEVAADRVAEIIIAYEPVWAIGTGKNATPADAAAAHRAIRGVLASLGRVGRATVLYGGSVNAGNIQALLAEEELDGVLVGGASLDATGWAGIVASAG